MGSIGSTETSGTNYQSTLRIIKEERRYYLHIGGSLESGIIAVFQFRHYAYFNHDGLRKTNKITSADGKIKKGPAN